MHVQELPAVAAAGGRRRRWAKVIDHSLCIGCHGCTIACKSEHLAPLGSTRTFVKQVEVGVFPAVRRHFLVSRCNQCDHAPCVSICPVAALYSRSDGIVDFDREVCIGCQSCIAACPYDAIAINPESLAAEKCNFCAHRIDQGLEPACVVVCPEEAIVVGDLNDPASPVSRYLGREKLLVRKPEKGTHPKVFYKEAGGYTLAPTAARYSGMHMWAEQHPDCCAPAVADGRQTGAARVAYAVPRRAPWDVKVSAYTWTKSMAAGAFALLSGLYLAGLDFSSAWFALTALVAGLLLLVTGVLLVAHLTRPARFWRVLYRPQWGSWLARGAYIIVAYALVLATAFSVGLGGFGSPLLRAMALLGLPLGLLTAVYTAFLFAQAKGRDLWQNPLLPLHLAVQAVIAGAAVLLLLGLALPLPAGALAALRWSLGAAALLHGLMGLSDLFGPHGSRDAALALQYMTRGRPGRLFWVGLALSALVPATAAAHGGTLVLAVAALAALGGLFAYEHAWVRGGQSVPLA